MSKALIIWMIGEVMGVFGILKNSENTLAILSIGTLMLGSYFLIQATFPADTNLISWFMASREDKIKVYQEIQNTTSEGVRR